MTNEQKNHTLMQIRTAYDWLFYLPLLNIPLSIQDAAYLFSPIANLVPQVISFILNSRNTLFISKYHATGVQKILALSCSSISPVFLAWAI